MYHRVAADGAPAMARYRVAPDQLEAQLRYLRDAGYYSVPLERWLAAMNTRRPLPGKAVVLTFDDGYRDFGTAAWPLLKRYGFGAVVFLVAGQLGAASRWDAAHGDEAPLMSLEEIRALAAEGVAFGSHTVSHADITGIPLEAAAREALRSRRLLEDALGRPVRLLSYPYGAADEAVAHLAGAAGYAGAVTCEARAATLADDPLLLPRIEVSGAEPFEEFVRRLAV
jgi:peptidoglycan/xylan/chitin deacetylase (PgdA/CDA1 family)